MARYNRHQIALPARLHLDDAKAALGIMEGDALNGACEPIQRRTSLDLLGADHPVDVGVQSPPSRPW